MADSRQWNGLVVFAIRVDVNLRCMIEHDCKQQGSCSLHVRTLSNNNNTSCNYRVVGMEQLSRRWPNCFDWTLAHYVPDVLYCNISTYMYIRTHANAHIH